MHSGPAPVTAEVGPAAHSGVPRLAWRRVQAWFSGAPGERRGVLLFLALGILLRLHELVLGRVFRATELGLIFNIENRDWAGLLAPMEFNQGAPILFLWIQKLALTALGMGEVSLRLWPFAAGVAALTLFAWWVLRRFDGVTAMVSVGVFAIGQHPVFFSTNAKQYSTDSLVAMLLLLAMEALGELDLRRPAYWGLVVLGASLVWLSHPSVFLIAGFGTAWLAGALRAGDRARLIRIGLFCAVTALSFALQYWLLLRALTANPHLQGYWQYAFMPFPPANLEELGWVPDRLESLLVSYTHTAAIGVALPLIVAGPLWLYRRNRAWFWAAILPFVYVLMGSAAHKYPIASRLLQFLYPLAALLIGLGVRAAMDFSARWGRSTLAGVTLVALLLVPQLGPFAKIVTSGERPTDLRPLLEKMRGQLRPQDCLLVHARAERQFRYYAPQYGLDRKDLCVLTHETTDREGYTRLLEPINPKRIWMLYSDAVPSDWNTARDIMPALHYLEQDRVVTKDTALLLFESSRF